LNQILKDIFQILNVPEKLKLWKLALADVFISVLDIIFLIVLLFLINYYTQPARNSLPGALSSPIFEHYPFLLIGAFTILFTLKNLIGFFISRDQYQFVYGVASRISRDGLLQYLNGPYDDYIHVDSSVMNRRINQQPIEFCHYVLNGIQQIFSQIVLIIITLVAIILFNPLLIPLLLIILAPPVILVSFIMKRRLHNSRQMGQKTSEKSIQYLQEALSGYIESNVYLKNEFFTRRYHRFQKQLNHYLAERLIIQAMPPRFIEIFAVFGLFVLILVNFFTFHNSSVQLITVGALMVAAYKIIPGIVKVTNAVGQVRTYSYTTAGLSMKGSLNSDKKTEMQPVYSITFENINFSFKDRQVLNAFSLNMNKGDLIGMTGMSGRGKTTFVNILLGFLQPESGQIFINGKESGAGSRRDLWSRTSYIKQQHFFLHATIFENITLQEGPGDTKKMEEILTVTGINELLKDLPNGLNTVITENGKNFSGGQRQRLIFARALYRDFDLLIMDEPFNELDEQSEAEMLLVLQKIAADGKIVLLITHRNASLLYCNRKIILDESA
jgi:ABC-type multidrug transport system fused ATPase/permease subunit